MPPGTTPFNSFPERAATIGGVMQTCELGDPCLPHEDKDMIGRTAGIGVVRADPQRRAVVHQPIEHVWRFVVSSPGEFSPNRAAEKPTLRYAADALTVV